MAQRQAVFSVAALALATSANGTARNGASQRTNNLQAGMAATCKCTIVTGSVVATFKFQGSDDNSTFVDVGVADGTTNGAAYSYQFAASGTVLLPLPPGIANYAYIRVIATLSGATTAAGDKTQVDYRFRLYNGNP